jgi:hypothetical protein
MVSTNKVGFNLRESPPLSRNMLHNQAGTLVETGQRTNQKTCIASTDFRGWSFWCTSQKESAGNLNYPVDVRDTAKSGTGCHDNHYLNYLVEFIFVNVGGSYGNAKVSSLPMSGMSVGGPIVVRGRESLPHGEGDQLFGIPTQSNQMLTGRNLL